MKWYVFDVIFDKSIPLGLDGEISPFSLRQSKIDLLHNSIFGRHIISLRFRYSICQTKKL